MHELADQLLSYLRAAWRHRWSGLLVAWVVALVGWTIVHLMPNRYESHARVYVDTQSMLRPLLSGIAVQPDINQMVAMMGRTLVSRTNLEKVIEMADVQPTLDTNEQREQLIARLSQELVIKSAGRENLYTISFTDNDRERAKRVVESLITIFVEGSIGDKRKDSDSAREFIEEQLESYSKTLVAAENAVVEFKRRHQGKIPGEGHDFYGPLSEAKALLRKATLDLNEAANSRDAIRQQLVDVTQAASLPPEQGGPTPPPSELDQRIQALQQKLDALRLVYTEQHPDIVASTRIVEQLKAQKAAEESTAPRETKAAGGTEKPAARAPRGPLYEQLKVSQASAEANVAAMRARVAEYTRRHDELQAAANALPQIEAEYKQLTRDYEVIKSRYDRLLERRESAQISGAVESSDAGMGFRIIDAPQATLKPVAPDRPRLISLVLLAALGCGAGIALLLSQLRSTFEDERRLSDATGIRVLGSVAMVSSARQKRLRASGHAAYLLFCFGLLAAYGGIMVSLTMSTGG
jgi:polysaccharide chain length determinant protein (PEP-CTERM system associated)